MFENSYMYDTVWTRWVDDRFIRHLQFFTTVYKKTLTVNDDEVLEKIRGWINETTDFEFNLDDIKSRFEMAANRYVTWKAIINRPDVEYDLVKNNVTATEDTWEDICSKHTLGQYYHEGNEHMYADLLEIFGPDSAREFASSLRTPTCDASLLMFSVSPITEEKIVLEKAKYDEIRELRKLRMDPFNKGKFGAQSDKNAEDELPFPGNPLLGCREEFNWVPSERFDPDKEYKSKRRLDF